MINSLCFYIICDFKDALIVAFFASIKNVIIWLALSTKFFLCSKMYVL